MKTLEKCYNLYNKFKIGDMKVECYFYQSLKSQLNLMLSL